MVWWHGGGFTQGSGKDYDAVRLATEGKAVVVTVNYRLGIFGTVDARTEHDCRFWGATAR